MTHSSKSQKCQTLRKAAEVSDTFCIVMERTGAVLASCAQFARTPWARMRGLLGRRALPEGEALVFERCWSIHTIGMRFPIDVVFVDRAWGVVALQAGLGPGRLVPPVPNAWAVVEMREGTAARCGLAIGDRLSIIQETA